MKKPHRRTMLLLLALFAASGWLALQGLGHAAFWDDEAYVAFLARSYNRTGEFLGWDGRNLYAYRNGVLLEQSLHMQYLPVGTHLCAAAFRLLGESNFNARLPFALIGLLTLAAWYALLREEFGRRRDVVVYGFVLLALSTVYLLYIRQCRYYAPAVFFTVLTMLFYRRTVRRGRRADALLLALSAAGLFYTQYLIAAAFLTALAATHLIFRARRADRHEWLRLIAAALIFAALAVPQALASRAWHQPQLDVTEPWLPRRLTLVWWHFRDLNSMGAMPWTIAAALVAALVGFRRRLPRPRRVAEWTVLCALSTVMLALLSLQATRWGNEPASVRYMVFLLPFLAGLTGVVLAMVQRVSREAAAALLVVLLVCNVLALTPLKHKFRWLLPAYVDEVTHPFPTAYGDTIDWLRAHAQQDDTVLCEPGYTNYPLMYYLTDRLRFRFLLDRDAPLPPATVEALDPLLYRDAGYPDWIVIFGRDERTRKLRQEFSRAHVENGRTVRYVYQQVKAIDCWWFASQRPEIFWHSFGPRRNFDRSKDAVYVYRRTGPEPGT